MSIIHAILSSAAYRGNEFLGWRQRDVRLRGRPDFTAQQGTAPDHRQQEVQPGLLKSAKADISSSPGEDFSPTPRARADTSFSSGEDFSPTPKAAPLTFVWLALTMTAFMLTSCARNDLTESLTQPPQAAAPIAVQTTKPEIRSVSRLISLPGEVHPWEETTLYAKVPGYLSSITVDKGDRVSAGQLIATIASPELTADREQAEQAYRSSVAAAQGSRATNERTVEERYRSEAAASKARADLAQMPATEARAQAQLKQAQAALQQAQEQKAQAAAGLEESEAQVEKAKADVESSQSDQKLAEVTYNRYKGIYDKNPMLIARQEVDVAESRASAAHSKTAAAQSAVSVAEHHVQAARSQVGAANSLAEQAQAQISAAQEQVNLVRAQEKSARKQVDIASEDVAVAKKQQSVTRARNRESEFQANAGKSAAGKAASMSDYTRIRSPFSGIVTKRFVDRGAFIQTASTSQNAAPIATVANLDRMRVYLSVPETQAGFVEKGTAVMVTTSSLPDTVLKGRIARTSASLDPKTRTLLAEADLPNQDGKILSGAYVTARIVMETHPHVISVPSPAVGVEKTGKLVFVVVNGKAKRMPVTTGFDDGVYTEIVEGLHGDEQVVVTGRESLTPNASVTATQWVPPVKKAK